MLASRVERLYTYADLLTWPEAERWELYDGTPVAMSSPTVAHQRILGRLFLSAQAQLKGKICEVFIAPLDVCLGEKNQSENEIRNVVQPDLMILCDKTKLTKRAIIGAPDVVFEIISESTEKIDQTFKMKLYEKHGVREYWIVDPDEKKILRRTLKNEKYGAAEVLSGDITVSLTAIATIHFKLSDIFA